MKNTEITYSMKHNFVWLLTSLVFGVLLSLNCISFVAEKVAVEVDLQGAAAKKAWVLVQPKGVTFRGGELVLDGLAHLAPSVVLREPALGDMTLTCKVYIKPKGKGGAFEVRFHSSDSASHQYVAVKRGAIALSWVNADSTWHELTFKRMARPEGRWLDLKLECVGSKARFYLDGKRISWYWKGDLPIRVGRVGFSMSQGLVRIKDIRIKGTAARLATPWRMVPWPKRFGTFQELPPEYQYTDLSGKLDLTVSAPFVISSHITRHEMGQHMFPHLFKLQNGELFLFFHKEHDIAGAQRVCLRSRDKGKTWTPEPERVNRDEAVGALKDGTVLIYDSYSFLKGDDVYAKEMFVSRDGGATFEGPLLTMIRAPQLKNTLSSPVSASGKKSAARYEKTSAQWSSVGGPGFWRSILELDDGSLLACGVARFKSNKKYRCVCLRSTDKGKTWTVLATIAYSPSVRGEGFFEPVMSRCSNGDLLCVMRTGRGLPLMQTRSTDGGKTWGPLDVLSDMSVDPDLCLMSNGVLACSYGRPGNRIMFSVNGTGREWTDRLKIFEYQLWGLPWSTGYTGIVEVEPGKLLLVYDRRDPYPASAVGCTTAVQGVYITVRKK